MFFYVSKISQTASAPLYYYERDAESDQVLGIFVAQGVLAWVNVIVSAGLLVLIFSTYSVTQRELTFERQSRIGVAATGVQLTTPGGLRPQWATGDKTQG